MPDNSMTVSHHIVKINEGDITEIWLTHAYHLQIYHIPGWTALLNNIGWLIYVNLQQI